MQSHAKQSFQHEYQQAPVSQKPSGAVEVLYLQDMLSNTVTVQINSIDLKVFVDSGAQRSIMSRDCAQRSAVFSQSQSHVHFQPQWSQS